MSTRSVSLSVIVPVHGVQGYLRQCLDSILAFDCPNLEIIAVDDASPDGCGAILDEYAEADSRVRVRHLEENVGLGEARNIGLDMAIGEYVWFFDSDDYATEGAVRSIFDRLEETRPDVLIFDYARGYWHGKIQRSVINDLFREPPAPDTFHLLERPSVLQLMMTAWNKAIRREFLVGLGLRFSRGFYEDLNVTYPILMAAEKLSLLDEVCYVYRQRRRGAITRTTSRKHFDAFAQYERVFAFMDELGPQADPFRPLMFDRAIWHLLVILERGDRVAKGAEAEFFHAISKFSRAHRPQGHELPVEKLLAHKYRLIEKDAARAYAWLCRLDKSRSKIRKRIKALRRRYRSTVRLSKRMAKSALYKAQLRAPIDENLAVFAAYWYRGYACNPAAIYEKMRELAPGIRGVWVVKNGTEMPKGVPFVYYKTPAYYRTIARGKYFVNNVNWPDHLIKRKGTVHLMTQHGTPLKKMGLDQMDCPVGAGDLDFRALITRSDRWDFLISSNPLSTETWERSFPCSYEMLEIGYPRNDRYFRATSAEVARLRAEIGIPEGKKAILFAPTHRDYQKAFRPQFDVGRVAERLGPDYVLLLRSHYYYSMREPRWPAGRVIDVSRSGSVENLALASDALVTDYSSIMFDYAVLDATRPIVIYANDWDTYVRTRGVNFDLTAFPPGLVATSEDELVAAFVSGAAWGDAAVKHRTAFQERFCPWEDGKAAERAVRRVFLGESVPPRAYGNPARPAAVPSHTTTNAQHAVDSMEDEVIVESAEELPGDVSAP